MKDLVARAAFSVLRPYVRYAPGRFGKKFILEHVSRPYIEWREIRRTSRTRSDFRINCNVQDIIQRKIMYFGVWEPNLSAFLERRLGTGDGFLDIGANIGYFSLMASRLVGADGCVTAIEASPSIFAMLRQNIDLNSARNVRCENVAVSDRGGVVTIYKAGEGNLGATRVADLRGFPISEASDFRVECEVITAPLDKIVTRSELERAKIIKIDVEGSEACVVENILQNIRLLRNDVEIVCETSAANFAPFLPHFVDLGFQAYELPNDYTDMAYLESGVPTPPKLIDDLPNKQFDLVLSRQVSDTL